MIRFKNLKMTHMIVISICIVFVLGAILNIILVLYTCLRLFNEKGYRLAEA